MKPFFKRVSQCLYRNTGTRSGRLLAYREFNRLTTEQAAKVAQAKGLQLEPQPDYSLAEIYNGSQKVNTDKKRVGFN